MVFGRFFGPKKAPFSVRVVPRSATSPNGEFIFQTDPDVFDEWIAIDDEGERFKAYGSSPFADVILCEIVRRGIHGKEAKKAPIRVLYSFILEKMAVQGRLALLQNVAAFVEHAALPADALLYFAADDTDRVVVGTAVVDFVSLAPALGNDPMSRPADIIRRLERSELANRGAAFGALLHLGDARVCELLWDVKDILSEEELAEGMKCATGAIASGTMDYLLRWLSQIDKRSEASLFKIVAAGLINQRHMMKIPEVATGLRPIPSMGVSSEAMLAALQRIPIDEYTKTIESKLLAIEQAELPPRIMPNVLKAWGLEPSTPTAEALTLPVSSDAPAAVSSSVEEPSGEIGPQDFLIMQNPELFQAILKMGSREARATALEQYPFHDRLLCELVYFGMHRHPELIPAVMDLYKSAVDRLSVDARYVVVRHVALLAEKAGLSVDAFIPVILIEPEHVNVAATVRGFLILSLPTESDHMSRPKEMMELIESGNARSIGAVFGGLLHVGNPYICKLLWPLRDRLSPKEIATAVYCCGNAIDPEAVEFLIAWMMAMELPENAELFRIVALGFIRQRTLMRGPDVTEVFQRPGDSLMSTRQIPFEEYASRIAPKLRALEEIEPAPRIMPHVLQAWGLTSSSPPDQTADLTGEWRKHYLLMNGYLSERAIVREEDPED